MKTLWMPIYWPNYLADTAHFTTVEHGAYLLLIAHYWCNGGLPKGDAELARIARVSHQRWSKIRGHIAEKFTSHWRHERIEHELSKALKLQETHRENDRRAREKRSPPRRTHRDETDRHTYTNKDSKRLTEKEKRTPGFSAMPGTPEFLKWKDWAFKKKVSLWRELQHRETEGRAFDFEAQWPPN